MYLFYDFTAGPDLSEVKVDEEDDDCILNSCGCFWAMCVSLFCCGAGEKSGDSTKG
jgi:hypothetical protein